MRLFLSSLYVIVFIALLCVGFQDNLKSTSNQILIQGKFIITGEDTADGNLEVLRDSAILSQNGIIMEMGSYAQLKKKYPNATSFGGPDVLITPGFVNGHHHTSGITFFQTGMEDMVLEKWLGQINQDLSDRYYNELYGYMKHIKSGVTMILQTDNPHAMDKWMQAAKDSGIRVQVGMAPAWGKKSDFIKDFGDVWDKHIKGRQGRVGLFLAPWGIHWTSDELLKSITVAAEKYDTSVHVHLSETQYQKRKDVDKTLTEIADGIGFLTKRVSCGHCVWMTDNDLDLIKKSGASIVTNPASNLRLQSGIAPVAKMLEKGINVAMGMDGLAFNDDADIFAEMKLCWYLHKGIGMDAKGITSEDVFRMGTINGARALGIDDITGSLKQGKKSDLVVIDLSNIEGLMFAEWQSMVDALLIRGKASDVTGVMVEGEILYRDREFTKLDEAKIRKTLKETSKKPVKQKRKW